MVREPGFVGDQKAYTVGGKLLFSILGRPQQHTVRLILHGARVG
jgi:hypothetical protein